MTDTHGDLLRRIARFEEALRVAWDVDRPGVPRHLRGYRQDWLETLSGPLEDSSRVELQHALAEDRPLLISDYHPLPRARRDLAAALQMLPPEQEILLLLELLPFGVTLSASEALRDGTVRLATGALLRDAYRPALEVLARRGGTVAGAWNDRQATSRDTAAADLWNKATRPGQSARWVFHFGDWHLAEAHLPLKLRAAGVDPLVLHLSPEPVWRRAGLQPERLVQRLAELDDHWVWLRTPPPELWASQLTSEYDGDDSELAEGTEHLVESLSETWCQALGLGTPKLRLGVHAREDWEEFRSFLPEDWRRMFTERPAAPLFHPRLPMLWLPAPPGLNVLMEAAQHLLLCDSPLRDAKGPEGELSRQAWRSLGATLVNPFLRPPRWLEAVRSLFPRDHPASLADRARASDPARGGTGRWADPTVAPALALLQARVWGARCGGALASWEELDGDFLTAFLQSAGKTLEPRILTATIRAA